MVKCVVDVVRKIWILFCHEDHGFYLHENLTIWYNRRKQKSSEISELLDDLGHKYSSTNINKQNSTPQEIPQNTQKV